MEIHTLSDPTRFAEAIRGLARDAHRTLKHAPSATSLGGLSRRIELLESALGDRRRGPVGTWLDSLGREVRSAPVPRVDSSFPTGHLCVTGPLAPAAACLH